MTDKNDLPDPRHPPGTVIDARLLAREPEKAAARLLELDGPGQAAAVTRLHGKDRIGLIMLSPDPQALVRSLPAPEFWITVKELGEEDSIELLSLADPSQIQYIADLEWWHRDIIDPLAVSFWLNLMIQAGQKTLVEWFRQADEELLVSAFSPFFQVYKADPDNEGGESWRELKLLWTLDNVYYLHFNEPTLATVIERALACVRDQEDYRYYGLLEAIDNLDPLETQEAAYNFRMARLADYGFLDFDESFSIHEPIDDAMLEKLLAENTPAGRPPFAPRPAPDYPLSLSAIPPLLGAAISAIKDPLTIENIALGFASLVNRVLIADAMDLSKLDSVKQALYKVHSFTEMGLSRWSGGSEEKAQAILSTQHPVHLFRAGYTAVIELSRRAHALRKTGFPSRVDRGLDLLGEDGLIVSGLLRSRPAFYRGAENPDRPFADFRSGADVDRARAALERASFLDRLFFEAFALSDDELEDLRRHFHNSPLTFEIVFITAVCGAMAGRGVSFTPLSLEDARAGLAAMLTVGLPRRTRPDVEREIERIARSGLSRLARREPADEEMASRFVRSCFGELERELSRVDLSSLDPRFVGSLVIAG